MDIIAKKILSLECNRLQILH